MVREVIVVGEREERDLVTVKRIREILGNHRTAINRVMQLYRRHNVCFTVICYPHFQILMTQIAVRNRIHQLQESHIMHERGIHHRTNHEATARLRNIHTILQIIECGVAERGFHLRDKIVAMGKHLQTNIELVGGVGQSEVMDRYRVPRTLLKRTEVHQLGSREDVAVSISHKCLESVLRIGNVGLVVIVFHCRHSQLLVGLVSHTRTDDAGIVAKKDNVRGRVRKGCGILCRHHAPVLGIIAVVLVIGGTHLHILYFLHIVLVVGEGDQRFAMIR